MSNYLQITEDLATKCGFNDLREQYDFLKRSLCWNILERHLREICKEKKITFEESGAIKDIIRRRGEGKLRVWAEQHLRYGAEMVIGEIEEVEWIDNTIKVTWSGALLTKEQQGYTGIFFCNTRFSSKHFGVISNGIKFVYFLIKK